MQKHTYVWEAVGTRTHTCHEHLRAAIRWVPVDVVAPARGGMGVCVRLFWEGVRRWWVK